MSVVFDYILGKLRLSDVGVVDPAINARITYLENNEYKITYWEEISTDSGTITKPTGSTIILDGFMAGVDALVETIVNGKPSGQSPVTGGGAYVTVSSFDVAGNYTLSGTPSSVPVALLYVITISGVDYQNLNNDFVIASEPTNLVVQTINNGDTTHSPSSDSVYGALALKADLNSPALTGSPTAPTPTAGDNDTSIATTQFVQTELTDLDFLLINTFKSLYNY